MYQHLIWSCAVAILVVASPAEAGPEEEAIEAMAACRAIKADSVRLVCMDAASKLLDNTTSSVSPTPPLLAAPAPAAPATPVIDTPVIDATASERGALIAERKALEAERAALANERAAMETASPSLEQPSLLERLRPASRESSTVKIVKIIRRRRTGELRFITDEGLMFDQALSRINFQPPSSLPADATISFGALGSKWIRFAEEPDRKYKVSLQVPDL